MDVTQTIKKITDDIDEVRRSGQTAIDIEKLTDYLKTIPTDGGTSIEYAKMQHASDLAGYNARNASELAGYNAKVEMSREMFKSVIEAGGSTLDKAILINGGGVVALLGAIGAIVGKSEHEGIIHQLAAPLFFFGSGILLGALGFAGRYISQFLYAGVESKPKLRTFGHISNGMTWLLVLLSFVAFGQGVFSAYQGFIDEFPAKVNVAPATKP